VQPTKGSYATVDEPLGMMEARSVIDKDLADMETDIQQFRLLEAGGFLEGMNQDLVATALYGAVSTSPAKFNGLAGRFNAITTVGGIGSNTISISIGNSDQCGAIACSAPTAVVRVRMNAPPMRPAAAAQIAPTRKASL